MSNYPDLAQDWRTEYAEQANDLYDKYGEDRAWPGVVPFWVPEAVASIESGGDPRIGTNSAGASGLMQIVGTDWNGGGYEAGLYQSVTGEPATTDKLANPDDPTFNIRVGVFGLAERWMWMARDAGERDWSVAAMGYFGAWNVDEDGTYLSPAPEKSDGSHDGAWYRSQFREYIQDAAASTGTGDVWGPLEQGQWYDRGGTWTVPGAIDGAKDYVTDKVSGAAAGVVDGIVNAVKPLIIPGLFIIGGIALLAIGALAITKGGING